jgi:3D-(3,5/4)-trihydroxycyclohexane-1,2-dione acylhydrolase (decyclizing)
VVVGVGTRWSDFTTASRSLFADPQVRFVNLNLAPVDAFKQAALPVVADAKVALEALGKALAGWRVDDAYRRAVAEHNRAWDAEVERVYRLGHGPLPSQGEVIGAVNQASEPRDVIVCAAGSMPGDLHKLWRTRDPKGYHVEYGFSCMGYEIAGGLGVKLAAPGREVTVMVGDGSYLMMKSEIATSVQLGLKLTVVLLDNGGFGCINRLQAGTGGASFNNLFAEGTGVDFAAHAASLGAVSRRVAGIAELESALAEARTAPRSVVIVIATDAAVSTGEGGAWWDVAVPEISARDAVTAAHDSYQAARRRQRISG